MQIKALDAQLLSDMWIFRTVASKESFTAAARQLHVTQSAISQRISRLEARVGLRLLNREHAQVTLTEEGSTLLRAMNEVRSSLNAALTSIAQFPRGPLVVICGPSLASEWLVHSVEDFYRHSPDTQVAIQSGRKASGELGAHYDRIELSISYQDTAPAGLKILSYVDEYVFPMCSKIYRCFIDEMTLEGPLTLLHNKSPIWKDSPATEMDLWAKAVGFRWPVDNLAERYFNEGHLAYRAALSHQGIALGHSVVANRLVVAGSLAPAVDLPVQRGLTFYLCVDHAQAHHPKVRQFADWWSEAMTRTQDDTLATFRGRGRVPIHQRCQQGAEGPGIQTRRLEASSETSILETSMQN